MSSFYRRELHETMQPRKLKSKWRLLGGCRGGDEKSNVERIQKKGDEEASESSSSDDESSSTGAQNHTDDNEEILHYGSEDSDLSNMLDEELERAKADEVEEMELPLPPSGWNDCKDELHADEDNYGLEDLNSDAATDDEDCPKKQVPKWAEGTDLRTALLEQCNMPPDLAQIFAPSRTEKGPE